MKLQIMKKLNRVIIKRICPYRYVFNGRFNFTNFSVDAYFEYLFKEYNTNKIEVIINSKAKNSIPVKIRTYFRNVRLVSIGDFNNNGHFGTLCKENFVEHTKLTLHVLEELDFNVLIKPL